MPYFDPTSDSDKSLLHSDVRDHSELERVATQVEFDVINHYREELRYESGSRAYAYPPNGPVQTAVYLNGYEEDPQKAEKHFREALRHTIADLISFSLRVYDNEIGVTSQRRGGRSKSFAGKVPTPNQWPDGWSRRLAIYDNTEVLYGL